MNHSFAVSANDEFDSAESAVWPWVLGGLAGAAFYFGVVRLLLLRGLGPDNFFGRVGADPINLGSYVAFGCAMALLLARRGRQKRELLAFASDILPPDSDTLILQDDVGEYRRRLRESDPTRRKLLFLSLLDVAVLRARANWNAQDVADAVKASADLIQISIDAQYSMIRYLAWAIPSIGFIGTVYGVGAAMGAMRGIGGGDDGDPFQEAIQFLFTAFDTTLVALVLSLILMWFIHRIQAADDSLLVKAVDRVLHRFAFQMHEPEGATR